MSKTASEDKFCKWLILRSLFFANPSQQRLWFISSQPEGAKHRKLPKACDQHRTGALFFTSETLAKAQGKSRKRQTSCPTSCPMLSRAKEMTFPAIPSSMTSRTIYHKALEKTRSSCRYRVESQKKSIELTWLHLTFKGNNFIQGTQWRKMIALELQLLEVFERFQAIQRCETPFL